jgi:hypothetical protein
MALVHFHFRRDRKPVYNPTIKELPHHALGQHRILVPNSEIALWQWFMRWLKQGGGFAPAAPKPNRAALHRFNSRAHQQLVAKPGMTCDQITGDLLEASGNAGSELVLNPPLGSDMVVYPARGGPVRSNFHSVYTDGNYVFDRAYRDTPIPLAEWKAEVNRLNGGINLFPD